MSDVEVVVRVERVRGTPLVALPSYATPGSAGADLRAAVTTPMCLQPGRFTLVPTGIRIELPQGMEGQVRPRSGLAMKTGVTVLNAPGTVDSDYRGEIGVLLVNLGQEPVELQPGERIAQLVVCPVVRAEFREVESVSPTDRGSGGFGHTGRG